MTSITEELLNNLEIWENSPSSIQQVMLDSVERVLEGDEIVDPTSPFVNLMEMCATTVAFGISGSESHTLALYPELATEKEVLFRHMSDKDTVGVFSTPPSTTIKLLIPTDQITKHAVELSNGFKTVVIPKDTIFSAGTINLGLHYPVRIELFTGGALQALYDLKNPDVLDDRVSNVVNTRVLKLGWVEYLEISLALYQFDKQVTEFVTDNLTSFKKEIRFPDKFYSTKVFVDRGNSKWEEIKVTFNPTVYDQSKVTALVSVSDGSLAVSIPEIYRSTIGIGSAVRIDVYTTAGMIVDSLTNLSPSNWKVLWDSKDKFYNTDLTFPLSRMADMLVYADSNVVPGHDELTLDQLKDRVIYRTETSKAPIRRSDIAGYLSEKGYGLTAISDNLTGRVFVATKGLPDVRRDNLSYPVSFSSTTVLLNDDLINGESYNNSLLPGIGSRLTLLPSSLIKLVDGVAYLLDDNELTELANLSTGALVNRLNSTNLLFTPFHYVLDYTGDFLKANAYDLVNPVVSDRTYEDAVSTVSVTTKDVSVEYTPEGYVCKLTVGSVSEGNIECQLGYTISGLNSKFFALSTKEIIGDDTVFTFLLKSDFDVDNGNRISVLNLLNTLGDPTELFVDLTPTFDIFYLLESELVSTIPDFDGRTLKTEYLDSLTAVTHESVTFSLGERLDNLYVPTREILAQKVYAVYESDVPAVYPEDILKAGPYGLDFSVAEDGTIDFITVKEKGDVEVDHSGAIELEHRAGDLILDNNGYPVVIGSGSTTQWELGLTTVNGMYIFANTETAKAFRKSISLNIVSYLRNDLMPFSKTLHERTDLLFMPNGSSEDVLVYVGEDTASVSPEVTFDITVTLTKLGGSKVDVRTRIESESRLIVSAHLKGTTLSTSAIASDITAIEPQHILDVSVDRFEGLYTSMTLVDESLTFTTTEIAVVLPTGEIDVTDNMRLSFKSIG